MCSFALRLDAVRFAPDSQPAEGIALIELKAPLRVTAQVGPQTGPRPGEGEAVCR